jgi:hypothetical protein
LDYLRLVALDRSTTKPHLWVGIFESLAAGEPVPEAAITLSCCLRDIPQIEDQPEPDRAEIARLNDECRRNLRWQPNFRLMMTSGVSRLPHKDIDAILDAVVAASEFSEDNDPWGEHDFGSIDTTFATIFWKFSYCDLLLEHHSPNSADPAVTIRVLTIMLAEEY